MHCAIRLFTVSNSNYAYVYGNTDSNRDEDSDIYNNTDSDSDKHGYTGGVCVHPADRGSSREYSNVQLFCGSNRGANNEPCNINTFRCKFSIQHYQRHGRNGRFYRQYISNIFNSVEQHKRPEF